MSGYSVAIFGALFCYEGWDTVSFAAAELRSKKMISIVIQIGMAMVVSLYLAANFGYFLVLDEDTVRESTTLAIDFGWELAGLFGALGFAVAVCLSCLGTLNSAYLFDERRKNTNVVGQVTSSKLRDSSPRQLRKDTFLSL
jgi:solute carrier family 7 (L-type amino acid transporter), member 6